MTGNTDRRVVGPLSSLGGVSHLLKRRLGGEADGTDEVDEQ
ncbi:hypothetical protein [Haloterrigena salinisoli]